MSIGDHMWDKGFNMASETGRPQGPKSSSGHSSSSSDKGFRIVKVRYCSQEGCQQSWLNINVLHQLMVSLWRLTSPCSLFQTKEVRLFLLSHDV